MYRGSDRGHVTLHFRGSVRDPLRGGSGALCRKQTEKSRIQTGDPAAVL